MNEIRSLKRFHMATRYAAFTLLSALLLSAMCFAQVRVRGYVRSNGTYVAPHYRSSPDGNFYNNWSTKGNINPYTGKEGTKVTPPNSSVGSFLPNTDSSVHSESNDKAKERAIYWKELGYNFDPESMSAYAMDSKVKDIERAAYWKAQGYQFDPDIYSAYGMDQKVKDIQRAAYWKNQGYDFDPDIYSAYGMDQKVKDIQRAAYWKAQGYQFDPDIYSAYGMDQKVKDIQRAAYWKNQGYDFDPDIYSAYGMDLKVKELQKETGQLRGPRIDMIGLNTKDVEKEVASVVENIPNERPTTLKVPAENSLKSSSCVVLHFGSDSKFPVPDATREAERNGQATILSADPHAVFVPVWSTDDFCITEEDKIWFFNQLTGKYESGTVEAIAKSSSDKSNFYLIVSR